jgi:hypothetical protein
MKQSLAEIVDSWLRLPDRGLMAFVIREWAIERIRLLKQQRVGR